MSINNKSDNIDNEEENKLNIEAMTIKRNLEPLVSQSKNSKNSVKLSDSNFLNIQKIKEIDSNKTSSSRVCLIKIEIYNGEKKTIKITKDSNPDELAYDFCKDNNLDFRTMKNISSQIEKAINDSKKHIKPKSIKKSNDVIYNDKKINYGEYLYIKGQDQIEKVNQKLKKIKKEADFDSEIELTFRPKILKKNLSKNGFGTLNNESKREKKLKKNNSSSDCKPISQECTFKPKINSNYKVSSKFNERLLKYTESLNIINNKNKYQKDHMVDSSTGQPLFHPKLIARNTSNITNRNVFQINYDYAGLYKRNKEFLIEFNKRMFGKFNLCPNDTDKIFTEKKITAFKYIFELLDSDEDGTISGININRKALGPNLDNIISPIISQIIQQKAIIEENDFIQAMDVLFSAMSMNDRGEILNVKKNIKKKKNDIQIVTGIHKERILRSASSGCIRKMKRI